MNTIYVDESKINTNNEELIEISSSDKRICGILRHHKGSNLNGNNPRGNLIIFPGAVGYRCGAHDMLTRFARCLAADKGYRVLNIDFVGCGESSNSLEEDPWADDVSKFQDILSAVEFIKARGGLESKVLLIGVCNSTRSVVRAAEIIKQLCGIVLIGSKILPELREVERNLKRHSSTRLTLARAAGKILSLDWWRRLAAGDVNINWYLSNRNQKTKKIADIPRQIQGVKKVTFPIPFSKFHGPVLCINGEYGSSAREAIEWYKEVGKNKNIDLDAMIIKHADETFSSEIWERQLWEQIELFIESAFITLDIENRDCRQGIRKLLTLRDSTTDFFEQLTGRQLKVKIQNQIEERVNGRFRILRESSLYYNDPKSPVIFCICDISKALFQPKELKQIRRGNIPLGKIFGLAENRRLAKANISIHCVDDDQLAERLHTQERKCIIKEYNLLLGDQIIAAIKEIVNAESFARIRKIMP